VLKGVDGAIASYPSNTNWPATGTPPRSNFTYAATQTSTAEYQICFKCHSYANTNVQTWGGTGAAAWTDVGLEFDPNNQSYHPVVQALPATDPNANYGSNRLASAQLSGGWTPGQVMTCSDCHDSDSAASTGPHGSAVKWMLGGTNKSWPYQGRQATGHPRDVLDPEQQNGQQRYSERAVLPELSYLERFRPHPFQRDRPSEDRLRRLSRQGPAWVS